MKLFPADMKAECESEEEEFFHVQYAASIARMAAEQELLNQELVGEIDLKEKGIYTSIPATITSTIRSSEMEASPEERQ